MTTQYTLKHPFEHNGTHYTTLSLRRLRAGDFRRWEKEKLGPVEMSLAMIRDLAEMPPEAVDTIDGEDYAAIADLLGKQMGATPFAKP
jgi:hypothetical protein